MTAHFGSVEKRRRVYFVISYAESRKPPSSLFQFLGATTALSHDRYIPDRLVLTRCVFAQAAPRFSRQDEYASGMKRRSPVGFLGDKLRDTWGRPIKGRAVARFFHLTRRLHLK